MWVKIMLSKLDVVHAVLSNILICVLFHHLLNSWAGAASELIIGENN